MPSAVYAAHSEGEMPGRKSREASDVTSTNETNNTARRRDPDRKEKILAAAADLVAQRGFHAVSMTEIGTAVGISGAAIYRHFENKSALLVALFDRSIDDLLEHERVTLEDSEDIASALASLIDRQVAFVVHDREFARVYHGQVENLPESDRVRLRRKQRLYLHTWEHLVLEIHKGFDDAGARTLVNAAIGAIQSPLFHNVGIPEDRLEGMLTRAAYAVLGLDPPKPAAH